MTVEKGKKYKSSEGYEFTILSDPFETPNGKTRVAYWDHTDARLTYVDPSSFDTGAYALVIEPKYKIGDVVTDGEESMTIEGVTKTHDHRGKFVYLVRDEADLVFAYDESYIKGKVSS